MDPLSLSRLRKLPLYASHLRKCILNDAKDHPLRGSKNLRRIGWSFLFLPLSLFLRILKIESIIDNIENHILVFLITYHKSTFLLSISPSFASVKETARRFIPGHFLLSKPKGQRPSLSWLENEPKISPFHNRMWKPEIQAIAQPSPRERDEVELRRVEDRRSRVGSKRLDRSVSVRLWWLNYIKKEKVQRMLEGVERNRDLFKIRKR